jgi:serine/threonine protein kinase
MTPQQTIAYYRITAKLGQGGMGEVWRATDTKLGRDVALKILPTSFAKDPERMARFEREAKVLASLNHPHIAQIYGIENRALVMELVEGETLKGPLPLDTALDYARQIADALEAAHEKGIVHRDLKPGNIMVTSPGPFPRTAGGWRTPRQIPKRREISGLYHWRPPVPTSPNPASRNFSWARRLMRLYRLSPLTGDGLPTVPMNRGTMKFTYGHFQRGAAGWFWSRNGHELFYETADNRIMLLEYSVNGDSFAPGKARLWSEQRIFYSGGANLDLAPDGKRFAVLASPETTGGAQGSVHVMMLQNFFDEVKRRIPGGGK